MPDAITVLERLGVAMPAADACLLRFLSPQMRSFPSWLLRLPAIAEEDETLSLALLVVEP